MGICAAPKCPPEGGRYRVLDFAELEKNTLASATQTWPDAKGRFGPYGGRYVPETLVAPLEELEGAYDEARKDPARLRALFAAVDSM